MSACVAPLNAHTSGSSGQTDHEAAQPLQPIPSDDEEERLIAIMTERFDRVPPSKDIDTLAHILRDSFGAEMCLIGLVSTWIMQITNLSVSVITSIVKQE
jgi:hypothetical protein